MVIPMAGGTTFVVRSGRELHGSVSVSGATKNAGTKQMAAALMARGVTRISNMPRVSDRDVMCELLEAVGARVYVLAPDVLEVDASRDLNPEAPYELVSRMRASINVLGPLLARCGEARVALPGGDQIGSRQIDLHVRGLEALGAEVEVRHGYVHAHAPRGLHGAAFHLDKPSVGATENLLCAAARAKGTTVIDNAAREPEVAELCSFLTRMGADVVGHGTATLTIEGAEELGPVDSVLRGDRIEAGTFVMACGIAGGEIEIRGIQPEDLGIASVKLAEMGVRVSPIEDGLWVHSNRRLCARDLVTLPFPGFATDYMPMAVAMLCVSEGSAIVKENIYEGRFPFIDELRRLGADIHTEGQHAVVRGVSRLQGAPVTASDVRAGAALVLAGLVADGETTVFGCDHVDRGYVDLAGGLRRLGADIERLPS
jgi:UDP-N-acetylglucosamine 1-carboxyvinyltransferase